MLFIGGSAAHNVDGIQWFIKEVLPLVLKEHPAAVLEVAGAVSESVSDHPSVRKLGHVADLRALYQRAQICLAPLRFGTGLKIKVMEAMGYGRPVVATPVAAEGFDDLAPALAGVADDPENLARAISDLLADKQARSEAVTGQSAWVSCHITPEVAIRPLVELLGNPCSTSVASQLPRSGRRDGIIRAALPLCLLAMAGFVAGVVYQKQVTIGYSVKVLRSWLRLDKEPPVQFKVQGEFYTADELKGTSPPSKPYNTEAARERRTAEIARLEAELPVQKSFWASREVQSSLEEVRRASEAKSPTEIQIRLQRFPRPLACELLIHPLDSKRMEEISRTVIDFSRKLQSQGQHLLFMPLPSDIDVDLPLILGRKDYISTAFTDTELFLILLRAGVDVVDLRESFAKANLAGLRPFYRADHHWTIEGMDIAAKSAWGILNSAGGLSSHTGLKTRMSSRLMLFPETRCNLDRAPAAMDPGDAVGRQILLDGNPLRHATDTPVVVLGDSNVLHLTNLACDFTSQLAFRMGYPLAYFGRAGEAKHIPLLYEDMARKTGISPEVVIWVLVNGGWRDLGDWDMRTASDSRESITAPPLAPNRLTGKFVVTAISNPPSPQDATYPDALFTFKVRPVDKSGLGEAIVTTWAFSDRKNILERRVIQNSVLDLDLPTWDAACKEDNRLARLQQVDTLDEFSLPRYYWQKPSK
jgi:hypothetical protein